MEIVGTIAGTLSLGITICDGIIKYCRSWKSQDGDVRALTALATRLKQLLQILDQRLQSNSAYDPMILQQVTSSIQDCTRHINSVVHLSDRYKSGQTGGLKGKAKHIVYKLKFPFEKQALDELRDIMVAFRGNVDTALQILTTDLSAASLDAVQNVQRENREIHIQTIQHIQDTGAQITQSLTQELEQRLPTLEESVKSSLSQRIECSTTSIESTVENAISQSMVTINSGMQSSLTLYQRQIDVQREQNLQLESVLQLLAKLQHVKELEEDHHSLPSQAIVPGSRRKSARRRNCSSRQGTSLCNCNPTASTRGYSSPFWRGFSKQQETYIMHGRTCPMWYTSRRETSYQVNFLLFQKLRIFGTVKVGRNPYATIPGLSIAQNLSCSYVVPSHAPSFRVLQRYLGSQKRLGSSEYCISSCIRDLGLIFQSGHGSPQDALEDGCNLLDRAFTLLYKDYGNFSPKLLLRFARDLMRLGIEFREGTSSPIIQFQYNSSPSSIISQQMFYGASFQFLNNSLDNFDSRAKEALDLILYLSEEGVDFSIHTKLHCSFSERIMHAWNGFKIILNALKQNKELAALMDCGVLSMAVLQRNKTAMNKILKEKPDLLRAELNTCGHTPIHLAIGWPEGLEVLLAVVDESIWQGICDKEYQLQDDELFSSENHTPLDYAIAFGCTQSIRLLADADFDFNFCWNALVGTKALDPTISDIVLALILERFQQLHDFALQILPAEAIRALELERFEIFDTKVRSVLEYFQANNIHMTKTFRGYQTFWGRYSSEMVPYFCPNFGGIFHQGNLHPEAAKAFFDAGLRSVDCEVEQLTPLMNMESPNPTADRQYHFPRFSRFFGIVKFLTSNGAHLDKEIPSRYIERGSTIDNEPRRKHRAIHRIASMCWEDVLGYHQRAFSVEDIAMISRLGSTQIWREILSDSASDPCDCACSLGGCRPANLALKGAFSLGRWRTKVYLGKRNSQFWDYFALDRGLLLLENLGGQYIDEDVVRLLTFLALELTHTCCRHSRAVCYRHDSHHKMIHMMDIAEIHENQNEEAPLVDRLNRLVGEFMEQFRELALPLTVFLREHWKPRMEAELLERDILSETEREQFKELGVEILEDDDDEEADSNQNTDSPNLDDGYDSYDEWIESLRMVSNRRVVQQAV